MLVQFKLTTGNVNLNLLLFTVIHLKILSLNFRLEITSFDSPFSALWLWTEVIIGHPFSEDFLAREFQFNGKNEEFQIENGNSLD